MGSVSRRLSATRQIVSPHTERPHHTTFSPQTKLIFALPLHFFAFFFRKMVSIPEILRYCNKKDMKQTLILFLLATAASCGSYQIEDEGKDKDCTVTLHLSDEETPALAYPLSLFVRDHQTQQTERKEISEDEMPAALPLASGDYTLTICSGLSGDAYSYTNDSLSFCQNNCAPWPLLLGTTDIRAEEDLETAVRPMPAVCELQFTLHSMPENARSITVCVSPVSSSVSLDGSPRNDNRMCSAECRLKDGVWTATLYAFPSESTRTRMSVEIQTGGKTQVYSYIYRQALQQGGVYHISGNLNDGMTLEGKFQIDGWQTEAEIEMELEETEPDNSGGEDEGGEDMETIYALQLPGDECVWGNVYVWKADTVKAEEEVIATLISPVQWFLHADEAQAVLSDYQEDELGNWRMFTIEEAKEIRDQYYKNVEDISSFLENNGVAGFESNGRYLCCDADSTFSFVNKRIIQAGKTVKYYLRGVKKVKVIQK